MATFEAWVLRLHIAAGVAALVAGTGALATRKGGRRHRRAGKGFLASMAVTVSTVVPLAALDPTTFRILLTLVAVFSGYLAFSGYRVLSRGRPAGDARPVDWVAACSTLIACGLLGGWGLVWLVDGRSFGVVMAVFAAIGIAFAGLDVRTFRRAAPDDRIVSHLQRMLGAFIATVSAVSAVNLTPMLGVAAWLWPTAAGVPVIYYLSARYSGT
ncbi:hypothetical protein [Halobaculum sp. EA56]|uniref:hypothetical protein n=1 Tax=Halobaculum sp. EA56 TaxID=3421648 RepID=UPI003EBCA7B9